MSINSKTEQLDKLSEAVDALEEYVQASNKGSEYATGGHIDYVLTQLVTELYEQAEAHNITLSRL